MKGFTDRALILLSDLNTYEGFGPTLKYDYKLAIKNIVDYLQRQEIAHDCLITDALATRLDMHSPRWVATGAPEDLFYIHGYCSVPDLPCTPLDSKHIEVIRKKFPIPRGLSPSDRFQIVAKRISYMERLLPTSYDFVVVFGGAFRVKPQPGQAILRVQEKKLTAELTLGGQPVPINDFMQIDYATISLSEWGKYIE